MQWITDNQWRLVWVDRAWEEGMGAAFKSIEGSTGIHLVHPDDISRAMHTSIIRRAEERDITLKVRLRQHGVWRLCLVVAEPVFENGRLVGYRGLNRPAEMLPAMPPEAILQQKILNYITPARA